ncbi:MAG: indolepyruvate oxidoreductase subunit beta family protein [Pseudorhodoplanes sp.]|nr:indolepyruvate oxidoreductase subunit beta family protein [Pseudorhodoplanes sp.]
MTTSERPLTILIAALGGEGGGVLTGWIVSAADSLGYPVQSTSIPGVAQRTGATTYYIEILPKTRSELGGRRPVFALTPGIGDIDILVASELMEAARAVAAGFVTQERTLTIASSGRFYVMNEKVAMADGRYDQNRLLAAIEKNSQRRIVIDMEALARQHGTMVNAVMLGALAGCGRLPFGPDVLESAIRADGKAVDSNLRGFQAGLAAAREHASAAERPDARRRQPEVADLQDLEDEICAHMPLAAREVVVEGLRRLAAYQDSAYARLYLDRLAPIKAADAQAGKDGALLRETARHLALRMSYEDVIRVAQAKIDPARRHRIERDLGVKPGQPYAIAEFLKPGIEEFCSILPPILARPILAVSKRFGWLDRVHVGMEVQSTAILGYLRFRALAALRPFRRATFRYKEEQASIERWLALVAEGATRSGDLALEIAECARLIKGYGSTHKRGTQNFALIEERVIRPALDGRLPMPRAADAIASARTAALTDPEGETLQSCLAEIDAQPALRIAAE